MKELLKQREAARGRMNRAYKVRQDVLGKLAQLNAEYEKARQEFQALDRQIAEQNVRVLEPATKKKGKKKEQSPVDKIDNMTADQLARLKARLEQMMEG